MTNFLNFLKLMHVRLVQSLENRNSFCQSWFRNELLKCAKHFSHFKAKFNDDRRNSIARSICQTKPIFHHQPLCRIGILDQKSKTIWSCPEKHWLLAFCSLNVILLTDKTVATNFFCDCNLTKVFRVYTRLKFCSISTKPEDFPADSSGSFEPKTRFIRSVELFVLLFI